MSGPGVEVAPSPFGSSNAHICTRPTVLVAPYGRLVILKVPQSRKQTRVPAKRGEIMGFSRESRKRLMQLFGSIDTSAIAGRSLVITLTYGKTWSEDWRVWQAHFLAFLMRLERKYPKVATIWRLEKQKRGAPHWHLLVIGEPFIPHAWVKDCWRAIALQDDEYEGKRATECRAMQQWKQAALYISKYIAKESEASVPSQMGRVWGVRRKYLLPITLVEAELDPEACGNLKASLIDSMHLPEVPYWLANGHGGAWTMLDGSEALELVKKASKKPIDWDYVACQDSNGS
jgi:hypothetical protein